MSGIFNNWNDAASQDRLELVFEDRNKNYGAYQIRKKYSNYVNMAMIGTLALAFLITGGALWYQKFQAAGDDDAKPAVVIVPTTLDEIEEEKKEEKAPPPEQKTPEPEVETQAYVAPTINEKTAQKDVELFDPTKINSPSNKTKEGLKDPFGNFDPEKIKGPINTGGGDGDGDKGPVTVKVQASYPGGDAAFRDFIASNFNYPERCQNEGINGAVKLKFIVDTRGKVSDVTPISETPACPEFTKEAERVLKLTKWIPGNTNGKFFKSYREIPIILNIDPN